MRLQSILFTLLVSVMSVHAQNSKINFSYDDVTLSGTNILEIDKMAIKEISTFNYQHDTPEKKSIGKALLLSLLIPGAGEFYVGNNTHGKIFLGTEILAWGTFFINDYHASSLEKDYKAYARLHAGVTGSGHNEQYWIDIAKFDDIYSYNTLREKDRRFDDIYNEDGASFWQWDNKKNRFRYAKKRFASGEIKNRDVYFFTAILVNHIVSGINAIRLARKHNRSIAQSSFNYHLVVNTIHPQNNYFGIALSQSF